jgi:iron-sulfur cluster assembly protein
MLDRGTETIVAQRIGGSEMSTTQQPDVIVMVTPGAAVEVKKFMDQEKVDPARGGLRVSVQPGGCSGFKYGLLIEDEPAEDDIVVEQGDWKVFVDPFSAQYINGVTIDYVSSMQGSGFTFKNPNATGGCGCGSSFSA